MQKFCQIKERERNNYQNFPELDVITLNTANDNPSLRFPESDDEEITDNSLFSVPNAES